MCVCSCVDYRGTYSRLLHGRACGQKVLSTNKVKGPFLFSSFDEALNLAHPAAAVALVGCSENIFAAIRGQHGGINCKKDRQTGSRSLPGTATGLSNDLPSMHSRFSEATTPHAMMRANSKRRAA